eukprot:TRINITY_DN962_c0_g1_i1.p3 TRINITY_DN962_c0_g1~~TRINITY_DN962_c0_g1_i1.p3  ORF type:complete len:76 (+),score=12.82 TRINITY_DN962_c0_g1_i1:327-554(+)
MKCLDEFSKPLGFNFLISRLRSDQMLFVRLTEMRQNLQKSLGGFSDDTPDGNIEDWKTFVFSQDCLFFKAPHVLA